MPRVSTERRRATRPAPRSDESPRSRPEGVSTSLDEDAIFGVLRASRRRIALRYLDDHGGEAGLGELAEHVAAAENDVERSAVTPAQRKRVYIALHQNHLPKLANHGVIEYDRDVGRVGLRAAARSVMPHLYLDPLHESGSSGWESATRALRWSFRRLVGR